MTVSHAHVRTDYASQYVAQLLRGLMTRASSSLISDRAHATVTLPLGSCEFIAGKESLDIRVTAETVVDATLLEDMVSDLLDRSARTERLRYAWVLSDRHETSDRTPRALNGRHKNEERFDARFRA